MNPITGEQFKVPCLIRETKDYLLLTLLGFGYDCVSDDYKIVAVCCSRRSFEGRFSTYLYSVKLGVWRRIDKELFHESDRLLSLNGAFANGSYHWTFYRGDRLGILAFNMSTEVFHEVEVPLGFSGVCRLFSNEGDLCAFSQLNGRIDVWMMNEYGKVSSWTKLGSVVNNRNCSLQIPIYFNRDEAIVLVINKNTMVICHLGEGIVKDVVVDGAPAYFYDGWSFVGSLISPKEITSS